MVYCEIDADVPGETLGWRLPVWQTLLLHRFLPSCGGLVVYLTFMCFNIALIYEDYTAKENFRGTFGIILAILPALGSLIFTLASPPPGWQTDREDMLTLNVNVTEIKWVLFEILKAIFFPVSAIARYCFLIFWSMEAVCASYVKDKSRTLEALHEIKSPSSMELYLFLNAFIHSAPYALINIVQIMSNEGKSTHDRIVIQAVTVIAALMRMASTATIYRRFEREKICGRKYPWVQIEEVKLISIDDDEENKQIIEEPTEAVQVAENKNINRLTVVNNLDDVVYRKDFNKSYSFITDLVQRESTDSDFLTPIASNRVSEVFEDEEKFKPIWDRIAPKRKTKTFGNVEENIISPPPAFPAPRPKSLAMWAEYVIENAESFPDRIAAPVRHRLHSLEPSESSGDVPIPQRVPRNFKRGLEPQDVTAALISYFGWHLFFISRMLSLAAFLVYFPWSGILVLLAHYQLMFLLLVIPEAPLVRRAFYIFLAFVYIFCLLEFKVRFRHVRVWHLFWLILCSIETLVFTGVWLAVDTSMHFWWKNYVLYVIFVGTILSYLCLFVYYMLLKPKETIVYINVNDSQAN